MRGLGNSDFEIQTMLHRTSQTRLVMLNAEIERTEEKLAELRKQRNEVEIALAKGPPVFTQVVVRVV